jgi:hypothetical protein
MSCIDVAKTGLCTGKLLLIHNLQWVTCAACHEWRYLLYMLKNATQENVVATEENNYKI